MADQRQRQLAYSQHQPLMLDEAHRRRKAAKIARVVEHFLGQESFAGMRLLDVGCSGGIQSAALQEHGADVLGVDIDVPGLALAAERFGDRLKLVCTDAQRLPLAGGTYDVVVLNQVYEHVVDPASVLREVARMLAPHGVVYLGLQNRLALIEPHYRLPFLSWLPRRAAHRYVRAAGRADQYYERPLTLPGLRRLLRGFSVWDYTGAVIADPGRFAATDVVPAAAARLPKWAVRTLMPLVPQYVWVATLSDRQPAGPRLLAPPVRLQ